MDEIRPEDIERDFVNTLLVHKGRVSFFLSYKEGEAALHDLETQKKITTPFALDNFRAIRGRIGMVNYRGGVSYMTRVPKRAMPFGMSRTNTKADDVYRSQNYNVSDRTSVYTLTHKNIVKTLRDSYPSVNEAYELAVKEASACAFDRQFAVDHQGRIYFKDRGVVGVFNKDKLSIEFNTKELQFIGSLLEVNCEKACRPIE